MFTTSSCSPGTVTSDTIDLVEERYEFEFYVMGTLGPESRDTGGDQPQPGSQKAWPMWR